jgi:hypothetical protein
MPKRDDAMSEEEWRPEAGLAMLGISIVEFDPKSCPNKYREPRL